MKILPIEEVGGILDATGVGGTCEILRHIHTRLDGNAAAVACRVDSGLIGSVWPPHTVALDG